MESNALKLALLMPDHYAVENKHYPFGQSSEKGVWYTEEKIKGGPTD